jgi:antitoxin component YwqK of YwqJK toxin-antitoxin module
MENTKTVVKFTLSGEIGRVISENRVGVSVSWWVAGYPYTTIAFVSDRSHALLFDIDVLDGKLVGICPYKNGQLNGVHIIWGDTGAAGIIPMINGRRHGVNAFCRGTLYALDLPFLARDE